MATSPPLPTTRRPVEQNPPTPWSATVTRWLQSLAPRVWLALSAAAEVLVTRWRQVHAHRDDGSITVEKAIIAAIAIGLALGLMAAIAAVVTKYQARIQ
jgi:hypothetical protein